MKYIYYLLAYLVGSISFSYILVKLFKGDDIRETGSKNAGGTNVTRNFGLVLGIITTLLDMLKGTLMVFLFRKYDLGSPVLALFFTVLGHCFPIFFGFKGGKGIATTVGGVIYLFPRVFPLGFVVFFVLCYLTKYVSLGSITMVSAVAVNLLFYEKLDLTDIIAIVLIWFMIFFRHKENIKRILTNTENKFKVGGK